jgi:hypothetical protein
MAVSVKTIKVSQVKRYQRSLYDGASQQSTNCIYFEKLIFAAREVKLVACCVVRVYPLLI